MSTKTYMPTFSKNMNEIGKYAFEHQTKLYDFIENDEKLTDEERAIAKETLDSVIKAYPIFKEYWRRYRHGEY